MSVDTTMPAWVTHPEPVYIAIDGTRSRFLRSAPVCIEADLSEHLDDDLDPIEVYIEAFEASSATGSQEPSVAVIIETDGQGVRLFTSGEARALAGALTDHADMLDAISRGTQ